MNKRRKNKLEKIKNVKNKEGNERRNGGRKENMKKNMKEEQKGGEETQQRPLIFRSRVDKYFHITFHMKNRQIK